MIANSVPLRLGSDGGIAEGVRRGRDLDPRPDRDQNQGQPTEPPARWIVPLMLGVLATLATLALLWVLLWS